MCASVSEEYIVLCHCLNVIIWQIGAVSGGGEPGWPAPVAGPSRIPVRQHSSLLTPLSLPPSGSARGPVTVPTQISPAHPAKHFIIVRIRQKYVYTFNILDVRWGCEELKLYFLCLALMVLTN